MGEILIAISSGLLMAVQGIWNETAARQTGLWLASGFVQLTALAVCAAAWLITERGPAAALLQVKPWYCLMGGILGAVITVTVVKSVRALGPAKAMLLIVTAQTASAYLIELAGLFGTPQRPFELRKLFGLVLSAVGMMIFF